MPLDHLHETMSARPVTLGNGPAFPDRPDLHAAAGQRRRSRDRSERRVGVRLSRALRVVGCI